MKPNSIINGRVTMGKAAILFAASFFSATAFADTCPSVDKIHFDQKSMYWVTDSGWISALPATLPPDIRNYEFSTAQFSVNTDSTVKKPNEIQGLPVKCIYSRNPGDSLIYMQNSRIESATIQGNTSQQFNGAWIANGDPKPTYGYTNYICHISCTFNSTPLEKEKTLTSPFGR